MADSQLPPTDGLDDDRATHDPQTGEVRNGESTTHDADGSGATRNPRRRGRWHVASYGEERVCSRPGCGTQLSRYNEKSYCASHDAADF